MTEIQRASITLRGFKETDCNQLAKLCNNRKIWDNLRDFIPSPYSEQNAVDFIKICRLENPQVTFAIHYNEELTGCIGLVPQSDIYRLSAEIGYWIGEPFWGLGIATTAVELLTEYGFEQLKLIRIYSGVFEYNLASQRVLEKAGYKKEGVFEKSIIKNGVICNEYRYAKIVGESLAVGY